METKRQQGAASNMHTTDGWGVCMCVCMYVCVVVLDFEISALRGWAGKGFSFLILKIKKVYPLGLQNHMFHNREMMDLRWCAKPKADSLPIH